MEIINNNSVKNKAIKIDCEDEDHTEGANITVIFFLFLAERATEGFLSKRISRGKSHASHSQHQVQSDV